MDTDSQQPGDVPPKSPNFQQPPPHQNESEGTGTDSTMVTMDDEHNVSTGSTTDDELKMEGRIHFKLERFSEFMEVQSGYKRLSDPVFIRGLPWKILTLFRGDSYRRPNRNLSCFVQCNTENHDGNWNCAGSAILRVLSQKEGKPDFVRHLNHVFHAKENDWGFTQFMTFAELMNPERGWYDGENDTITIVAEITADAPHGLNWDSKQDTGFIGLRNQGATCYMNSILQTLFHTNKLRKAVYQMPTEEDNPETSVAVAMQRVFYELHFSNESVGTKKLTKSFGWESVESFLQHDVQEFCRVLLDNLESKMRNTKVTDTIPSLLKGRMKSYIKCKQVDFESSREECFYDLQLNVKGNSNVIESFKDYIGQEILDGENKYDAGEYGLQPAEKGLKFISFPPMLHLQLMRFQYDPLSDANVKINDRFEFTEVLDLSNFCEPDGQKSEDDNVFLLHAVLVHSGDFHSGHYVAFINANVGGEPKWCRFDDDVVCRVPPREAISANFGGDNNNDGKRRPNTSAYMLVYVKKNAIGDVLCPVSPEDIPEHLKCRFESEKQTEKERRMEKEVAINYCEVTLLMDEDMRKHHGFELFEPNTLELEARKIKVPKTMDYETLYEFVATNMSLKEDHFRLWDLRPSNNNYNHRPGTCLRPKLWLDPSMNYTVKCNRILYLEMGTPDPKGAITLTPYDQKVDLLLLLKYFHPERRVVEYIGSLVVSASSTMNTVFHCVNQLIGQPPDTKIELFVEERPDSIQPFAAVRLNKLDDGCILVAENIASGCTNNVAVLGHEEEGRHSSSEIRNYFDALYSQIEVEAYVYDFIAPTNSTNNMPVPPPYKGQIGLDWSLPTLCQWLGAGISYDPEKILLWKVAQPSEKPFIYLNQDQFHQYQVSELLSLTSSNYDPLLHRVFKLFYTKLPVRYAEMENRRHQPVQILDDKYQINEASLFPRINSTIGELLNEARPVFHFANNGTGVLRLVHVYSTASCSRVLQVLKEDMTCSEVLGRHSSSAYVLRVEEVPRDQLEIRAGEHLLPVAHFDKEPTRMFGVPFFIKVSVTQPVANIRKKVKEVLVNNSSSSNSPNNVTEKEFEKFRLCIVMNNRVVKELNEEQEQKQNNDGACCVDENGGAGGGPTLSTIFNSFVQNPSLSASPYLGLDHLNKQRGMRGGAPPGSEKSIVIHN